MSFWQRVSTDVSNAANDVYSHWIIGDDAGKSALISFIYRPTVDDDELGMTFIEINHRAYVKSVLPGSVAYVAGVLPQDAVQLAVPIRREWEMEAAALSTTNEINDQKDENDHQADVYGDDWIQNINRIAKTYGLRLERKGARTSYNHLLRLVSRHILHDDNTKIKQHFISPPTQSLKKREQSIFSIFSSRNRRDPEHVTQASAPWDEPPTPSKLCAPIMHHDELTNDNNNIEYQNSYLNFDRKRSASTEQSNDEDDDDFNDEKYGDHVSQQSPSAILFVLRRTRQRQVLQETASCVVPTSFRLDDECDLACTLVRRLAPTADMETPIPDTWEELVHDGTDWLLGHQSMLPPKTSTVSTNQTVENNTIRNVNNRDTTAAQINTTSDNNMVETSDHDQSSIPLDAFEKIRTKKLATLRSRITTETMLIDRTDDVEAATVRAMIQKAVGLAFVRASKIVLGVSIHGGSGIVISRLPDGTWSAPSAIGTWGIGLGLQFGLEVAEYIFILQTQEAMDHFKRGGSYTVGGNMGIAIGGLGREAYGAASVGGGCGTDTTSMATNINSSSTLHDEEYNVENDDSHDDPDHRKKSDKYYPTPSRSLGIAPIVAYAKSQGLYVGVSLEGSRIFTRDDINFRTYKFTSGNNVTADDILSGKVPTPAEAEELYAALHSVEFAHEMSRLPRPPEILRKDSANAWTYDRSITVTHKSNAEEILSHESAVSTGKRHQHPFAFFSELSAREADECSTFEAQFKNFLYGGVSVQRLIIDVEGNSNRTGKERRTLWLMLPEVGSLRIGFVSKLSDGEGVVSNKSSTQRARRDDSKRTSYDGDNGTVGSEELTLDSALITKDGSTLGPIRQGNVQLSENHSVALTDVVTVSQEPTVQIKFKGEDKTQHLRVISIQDVSGTNLLFLANNFREAELLVCGLKLLLERETARLGVRGGLPISALGGTKGEGAMSPAAARGFREISSTVQPKTLNISSLKTNESLTLTRQTIIEKAAERKLSSGHWGKLPGRNYLRGQASSAVEAVENDKSIENFPLYEYMQPVVKSISKSIRIPLPLPLCRVLLLDSTSPVIKQWQKGRGDKNVEHSQWIFPTATPRELERHTSEHQLIASGSMCGAQRTASFDRPRYGSFVRLSETYVVDTDDPKKMALFITEDSPRRGFEIKVKVLLRTTKDNLCEATAFSDIRPVGKDMSNQSAVHKAYLLVLNEVKIRYGTVGNGLLACFLSVVDEMANSIEKPITTLGTDPLNRSVYRSDSNVEEKKSDFQSNASSSTKSSGLVSFEDMLKTGRESPEVSATPRPETPGLNQLIPEANPAKRIASKIKPISDEGEFAAIDAPLPSSGGTCKDSVLIEVKPLPKIRLALMPSPREEDEETSSSKSPFQPKPTKKKKKKSSSSKADSKQSSARLSNNDLKRHIR